MQPLLKILAYVAVVLAIGIAVSPPAYWACQWLIGHGWLEFLRDFPFHRYYSRTVQVAGIVLLIPLVWWLRIRRPGDLGIQRNPHRFGDLLAGLGLALLMFSPVALGYLVAGIYQIRPDPEWTKFARVAGTAAAVGCIEEIFFRGVLLGLLARTVGRRGGAVLSSLIFAGIHFVRPARMPDAGPVTWSSGWEQTLLLFHGAPPMPVLAYAAATLFLAGLILAFATLQTRSLWLPIGLHAGWIFAQQGFHLLARSTIKPPAALLPLVGPNAVSGAVPTGLVALAMLAITWLLLWLYLRRRTG